MASPQGMSAEEKHRLISLEKEAQQVSPEQESPVIPKDVLSDMIKLVQRIANGHLAEVFSDSEENEVVAADILARAGIERVANANFIKNKWIVKHDSVEVFRGSNFECYRWILNHQPQSVDWAIKYSGYEIVNLTTGLKEK